MWDLVREDSDILRRAMERLPRGALLLIAGGPPCAQLTKAGAEQGRVGLAGQQSVLFYAMPAIAYRASQIRPDLLVHVVIESAANAQERHQVAMAQAMALPSYQEAVMELDAAAWCAFPRKRILMSTLPKGEGRWRPDRRPEPWEQGWAPRHPDEMPTMLRARNRDGQEPLRTSTYQYAPSRLVYSTAEPWKSTPDACLADEVRRRMPEHVRDSWDGLARGRTSGQAEERAMPAALWLAANGRRIGARAPSAIERSRAMGLGPYLHALGLSERMLYDGQGNASDYAAIQVRVAGAIGAWVRGGHLEQPRYHDWVELRRQYHDLRDAVRSEGLPAVEEPLPADLVRQARPPPPTPYMASGDTETMPDDTLQEAANQIAAEDGRMAS